MLNLEEFPYRFELRQHGVAVTVCCTIPDVLARLRHHVLLPDWHAENVQSPQSTVFALGLEGADPATYVAYENFQIRQQSPNLEDMCSYLASRVHHWIAAQSNQVFVHAGVVCVATRALLLPGRSCSGKSTLVKALVDRGAIYFSDEFAVFCPGSNLVHPFQRILRLRQSVPTPPPSYQLHAPVPLGAVFNLIYSPQNRRTSLHRSSPGEMALALFQNTVAGHRFGSTALHCLVAASRDARGWKGTRGEADKTADKILRMLKV